MVSENGHAPTLIPEIKSSKDLRGYLLITGCRNSSYLGIFHQKYSHKYMCKIVYHIQW
jgi:hypothetical protein